MASTNKQNAKEDGDGACTGVEEVEKDDTGMEEAEEDDNVDVILGKMAYSKMVSKYTLVPPPLSKKSPFWKHYMCFSTAEHPEKAKKVVCMLCGRELTVNRGTSSISRHLEGQHRKIAIKTNKLNSRWEVPSLTKSKKEKKPAEPVPAPRKFIQPRNGLLDHYDKTDTMAVRKQKYVAACTGWALNKNIAFSMFSEETFRGMFTCMSPDAPAITKAAYNKCIREQVLRLGNYTQEATKLERELHVGATTTDHWTSNNDETFSTNTFHYIEEWNMKHFLIDLKVYHGRTTGEKIFEDQKKVMENQKGEKFILMCVTDTTANMGKLGQYLRKEGEEHGYCVDHNIQCTARLAFNGKLTRLISDRFTCESSHPGVLLYVMPPISQMIIYRGQMVR